MFRNNEEIKSAVKIEGYGKKYESFELGPLNLEIPQGFVTALIGENGAGKSTLLDAVGGLTGSKEKITWLEKYKNLDEDNAREEVAWCAPMRYFPVNWTIKNVKKSLPAAFDNFDMEKFDQICRDFKLDDDSSKGKAKKILNYSDGNKARLAIASVLARNTKLMIFDEPDSTLDPVIRDTLNSKFRQYINEGNGESSILFSTHNIADMADVVDYAVFLGNGKIIKEGFVEDLREEYRYVHGPKEDGEKLKDKIEFYYCGENGFEGLCKAADGDLLGGTTTAADSSSVSGKGGGEICVEVPTLQQLSILILRSQE